jgi:hypothetical protein
VDENPVLNRSASEIVVITPEAAWECQLRGKPYLKLEDFYDDSALYASHDNVFAEEMEWVDWVDMFLQRTIPVFGQARFRPAMCIVFLLQNLFDEFYAASYILNRLLQQTRPGQIWYWRNPSPRIPHFLHPQDSVYPAILPNVAERHGVYLNVISDIVSPRSQPTLGNKAGVNDRISFLRPFLGDRTLGEARQLRHAGLSRYVRSRLKSVARDRGSVLVLGGSYDLEPLVLRLRECGLRIEWLTKLSPEDADSALGEAIRSELSKQWQFIVEREEFWAPFANWGIGRNHLAESILSFWWHRMIPKYWEGYQRAYKVLAERSPTAVVTWEAGGGTLIGAMLQAAETLGVSSLIYQHGSTARLSGYWWYGWLAHAGRLLVYGDGTATQLQRTWPHIGHARAKIVPVGSARLDAIRASMTPRRIRTIRRRLVGNDTRPILLYAPAYFGGYGRAFSDAACYPDVSYFELQQRVVRLFAEFPNVLLLYKDFRIAMSGMWNPIPDFIAKHVPNGRVINAPPPLAEVFWAVDGIIIDHVITALGEALLTRKRIIVYDGGGLDSIPEPPEARILLRKLAVVAEAVDEFVQQVRAFLEAGDFSEIENPNDDFLRAYSTHLNDGNSVDRAASEVLNLLDAHGPHGLEI